MLMILTAACAGVLLLLAAGAACYVNTRFGELPDGECRKRFSALPNYADGKFVNREPAVMRMTKAGASAGLFRFLFTSENAPRFELPSVKLTKSSFPGKPEDYAVYWLGHSMLIFELNGMRFLTDPVFGNAAPIPGVVRRCCESPLAREELPDLDFVLVSHDHYDHMEYRTIRFLKDSETHFIVPLGAGARLRGWGIAPQRIHELNWEDSIAFAGLRITALTSRHFSGRSFHDRDRTLWAAFLIEGGGRRIFFGADGGYGKHFREIGEKYGPFDLVCLEIDAWNERWPDNHMFPEEVIRAFQELGGGVLLPIHWGVFDLAMHPWDESIRKVMEHAGQAKIRVVTPKIGEKIQPDSAVTAEWWRR